MQDFFNTSTQIFKVADYDEAMQKRTPSAVGFRIATLRQATGLTQRQLAQKLDVSQSNIGYWECGAEAPPGVVLPKMAIIFAVSVDEILGVEPIKPKRQIAKGKLQQLFEAASHLPRRQQQKIIEFVEPFVTTHGNGQKQAA